MQPVAHPSDSAAQREAERFVLEAVARKLGLSNLLPRQLVLGDGTKVNVDGVAEGPPLTLVEAYAHVGAMKGSQPNKVLADALKLSTIRHRLHPEARLIIALGDQAAFRSLNAGWRRSALEVHRIEIVVAEMPNDVSARVLTAQAKQKMVNEK